MLRQHTDKNGFFNYQIGVLWALTVCFFSASNDALIKIIGLRLDSFEVAFFRFFFGLITLLPFMLGRGVTQLHMNKPSLHILRAFCGVLAISLWCFAVPHLPLTEITTIGFTTPIFVLIWAALLLREPTTLKIWLVIALGFFGILITLGLDIKQTSFTLSIYSLLLILSAALFALQDIFVKKMVVTENTLAMLFYFALGTTLFGSIPLFFIWITPNFHELFFLFLLGAGGNLIQYCLFKAFTAATVSDLAPFRYTELIFSASLAYFIFSEIPHLNTLLGAAIIIPATLYVVYAKLNEPQSPQTTPEDITLLDRMDPQGEET